MIVPRALGEWTLEAIVQLVVHGYEETQTFDFKEDLSSPGGTATSARIEASACAFANTEGGFLVFGVVDRQKQPDPTRRVVGVEKGRELPREFGDKIRGVRPTLFFDFKNPPIAIPGTSRVLHVIHIPVSPERPHLTDQCRFYYRDAKGGNEMMPYEVIRESFLRYGERREKLRMLYAELRLIEEQVTTMQKAAAAYGEAVPLYPIDLTILHLLLVDVFVMIRQHPELLAVIQELRGQLALIRVRAEVTQQRLVLPVGNRVEIVREYRELLLATVPSILATCQKAAGLLEGALGLGAR